MGVTYKSFKLYTENPREFYTENPESLKLGKILEYLPHNIPSTSSEVRSQKINFDTDEIR
jgi:hypothetical protein